ncbi:hypothetical protein GCM10008997_00810 [Halomonas salifodinae]
MDFVAGEEHSSFVLLFQSIFVALFLALLGVSLSFTEVSIAGLSGSFLAVSIIHGLSQQIFVLATVESRSRGEVLRFSWQNIVRAVLVVGVAGGFAWHIRSPSLTLLVEAVLSLFLGFRIVVGGIKRSPYELCYLFFFSFKKISKVRWVDSLLLMVVMLAGFLLANIDRWMAASFLTSEQFALYGFAWVLLSAAQSVQAIVNSSVYPALARRYAVSGTSSSFRVAAKVSLILLAVGFVFSIPFYYMAVSIINKWFIGYEPSVGVIHVFLAVAAIRVSDFWSSHLIIIGKEKVVVLLNVVSASLAMVTVAILYPSVFIGEVTLEKLSYLALFLTSTNYVLVFLTSVKFRK